MNVCAFTAVCEEDAVWIPQYLREAGRLGVPFVVHLDRWRGTRELLTHPLCVGMTKQEGEEFTEQHKQAAFDIVAARKHDWAMAWDIDETFERRMHFDLPDADCVDIKWLNLWGDSRHIRVDEGFAEGHRVKFYNLRSGAWKFDHPITNGAKLQSRVASVAKADIVCLHWGMATPTLRRQHKERWDRIYTKAVGANPYGFWRDAIETEAEAKVVEHAYF